MAITIKELADVLIAKEPRMSRAEATNCAQTVLDVFGFSNSVSDAAIRASLGVHSTRSKPNYAPNEMRNLFYHLEELHILNTDVLETNLPLSKKEYRIHYWYFRPDWNKLNGNGQKQTVPFEVSCYNEVPADIWKMHAAKDETKDKAIAL